MWTQHKFTINGFIFIEQGSANWFQRGKGLTFTETAMCQAY